ncbi:CPBP family intramembrane metalloprotease [Salipaludibacillus sp. CUR1]|uniref:CPBP family intramembrane glutamic endopeptidase n=1 Tax=Salipaludibacillus sp. CUR1 TaxID=2820003 RepID=UPI001E4B8878|nr:CPBP family intramembrane metalloprotease [Salipaludibacillus sp. CUR1]
MNKQAEIVKKLTDRELLLNLYVTQLVFLVIALLLSWWWFGSVFAFTQFIEFRYDHLLIGLGFGLSIVLIEIVLYKLLPEKWFDDGGINKRVFSNRHPLHILFISIIVAVSEEVMFRGVIQSQFGIWIASITFALIHFRYLSNLFLFSFTVFLSFSLGLLFLYTENLLTVITAHVVIDFLLGLLLRYDSDKSQ